MALDVILIPIISVGTKKGGRESAILIVLSCNILVVTPAVEANMEPKRKVLYRELMTKVRYV